MVYKVNPNKALLIKHLCSLLHIDLQNDFSSRDITPLNDTEATKFLQRYKLAFGDRTQVERDLTQVKDVDFILRSMLRQTNVLNNVIKLDRKTTKVNKKIVHNYEYKVKTNVLNLHRNLCYGV